MLCKVLGIIFENKSLKNSIIQNKYSFADKVFQHIHVVYNEMSFATRL